jgi:hypothetical protein
MREASDYCAVRDRDDKIGAYVTGAVGHLLTLCDKVTAPRPT